jgi:hypothetical protein
MSMSGSRSVMKVTRRRDPTKPRRVATISALVTGLRKAVSRTSTS